MYKFEKHIGNKRAGLNITDESGAAVCEVDINPINLYRDILIKLERR